MSQPYQIIRMHHMTVDHVVVVRSKQPAEAEQPAGVGNSTFHSQRCDVDAKVLQFTCQRPSALNHGSHGDSPLPSPKLTCQVDNLPLGTAGIQRRYHKQD